MAMNGMEQNKAEGDKGGGLGVGLGMFLMLHVRLQSSQELGDAEEGHGLAYEKG